MALQGRVPLAPPTPEGYGDPLAEAEALLAALSAGPVGIGDQLGHTRRELVLRTCRADGVLVKPDLPVAALDRCFRGHGYFGAEPLVAETWSDHPAGRFVYLVTMNASHASKQSGAPLRFRVELAELGAARPAGPVVRLRLAKPPLRAARRGRRLRGEPRLPGVRLPRALPAAPRRRALFGDVTKYATMGDRRVSRLEAEDGELRCDVLGAPGEGVALEGCAPAAPRDAIRWTPTRERALDVSYEPATGRFRVNVPVGALGVAGVTLAWA